MTDFAPPANRMKRRLTARQWIDEVVKVWGEKYDYSLANFVNTKTKLTVICPKHGPWDTSPDNHLRGKRGCPACGSERLKFSLTKPFVSFLDEARKIHGDLFSYDESTYAGAKQKLKISCTAHGIFLQSPEVHLRGSGCPRCSDTGRLEKQRLMSVENVNASIAKLSDGCVSIVSSTFSNINQSASFRCDVHGTYQRLVNTALHSKHPCLKCSNEFRLSRTTDSQAVLVKVHERFGLRYMVEVKPARQLRSTRIVLTCSAHGPFELLYPSLSRSPGCPVCARESSQENRTEGVRRVNAQRLNARALEWLERSALVHQGKYDYAKANYVDAKTPVLIICPIHGEFNQIPDTHLKSGCRECADDELLGKYSNRFFTDYPERKNIGATLYYIKLSFEDEVFFKVGVTTTTLKSRFSMTRSAGVEVAPLHTIKTTLYEAYLAEQTIQSIHGEAYRYRPKIGGKNLRALRIGPSECFSKPLPTHFIENYFRALPSL